MAFNIKRILESVNPEKKSFSLGSQAPHRPSSPPELGFSHLSKLFPESFAVVRFGVRLNHNPGFFT